MKPIESYFEDMQAFGLAREDNDGICTYRVQPEAGEGWMRFAGDMESCYACWGDVTLKKDYANVEAADERYLGFSSYALGNVEYYNVRSNTERIEHGLNFYIHFPNVFRYMRIRGGERFLCGGMVFREKFIDALDVPADFWEVAADVLNPAAIADFPQIFEIWEQVKNCRLKGNELNIYVQGKGLEIFALTLDYIYRHKKKQAVSLSPQDMDALALAKSIMAKNMVNPPSIQGLARQIGINQQKLMTGFKQTTGCTVYGYLKQLRMERALTLLRETDLPVVQVAKQVGYHGDGHFQKAFASVFGETPSFIRRELRGISG